MPKLKAGHISPNDQENAAINAGIAADPLNPEWTVQDFARARSTTTPKVSITIRLDADVIEAAKAIAAQTGTGYQTVINDALRNTLAGGGSALITENTLRRILREELRNV